VDASPALSRGQALRWHDEMGDFSSLEQVKWLIKFIPDNSVPSQE